MTAADPYREWDAAYVMGSLSPSERHEYELHRAQCPECAADVAEIAGLPGILSVVPVDRATALLVEGPDTATEAQPALLPKVLQLAARRERRERVRRTVLAVGALAAAAAILLAVFVLLPGSGNDAAERGQLVALSQTVDSPVTADARLVPESWGTTIQVTCRYAETAEATETGDSAERYALYVTDESGTETAQATWIAGPGSVTMPTATTSLRVDEIASIDIRWVPAGLVLLEADL